MEAHHRAAYPRVRLVLVQLEANTGDRVAREAQRDFQVLTVGIVSFGARDAARQLQHFAQLAGFVGAEAYRELSSAVDRRRQGISEHTEVVGAHFVTLHDISNRQAVEVHRELEALYLLGRAERHVEHFTCFHLAVSATLSVWRGAGGEDVEQQRAGRAVFGLLVGIGDHRTVQVTNLDAREVVVRLAGLCVAKADVFRERYRSKRIARVGELEAFVNEAPGGVVRQFRVDTQDQLAQFNDVERRHRVRFVHVGSDDLVRRVQRLDAQDVLGHQHQVERRYTVHRVVVFHRRYRVVGRQRQVVREQVLTGVVGDAKGIDRRQTVRRRASQFYLCVFYTLITRERFRLQLTGHRDRVATAVVERILDDHIRFAVCGVAGGILCPQLYRLRAHFVARERHIRDRLAKGVNREARALTRLADRVFQLVARRVRRRRRAVVFGVLQEVRGPQRYHARRHDVHTQTIEAYHRRRFAVFHYERVFAYRLVAATVRNDPLDLVRAVGQFRYHTVNRRVRRVGLRGLRIPADISR